MIRNILISFMLLFQSLPFAVQYAHAAEAGEKGLPSDQPISITADRLEAYDAKKLVVFIGNAEAVQGDRTMKAEKFSLYYKGGGQDSGRENLQNLGRTQALDRIEAEGHVSISQGDRVVTGDRAVYYQEAQKIIVTGHAVLQQGKSIVQGDKIEVFLNENTGIVEAQKDKRVKATIYPADDKGK